MMKKVLNNLSGEHLLLMAVEGDYEIIMTVDHELDRRAGIWRNNSVRCTSGCVVNAQELQPAV